MKPALVRWLKRQPVLRPLRLAHARARTRAGQPDWRSLLERERPVWESARARARGGPRILVATTVGAQLPATQLESMLAVALTLRGARVEFLLCDATLGACMVCDESWYPNLATFVERGPEADLCRGCTGPAARMLDTLGLEVRRIGSMLSMEDRERASEIESSLGEAELDGFELSGVAVGEHARAGALRFFARGSLEGEPFGEEVLRRFFRAALLTVFATRRLLESADYDATLFHHGIYVPQGPIGDCARSRGVRVVNWNPAYRRGRFIFSHGDTYHRALLDEPTGIWESAPFDAAQDRELDRYLRSRQTGSEDWIWFHDAPVSDPRRVVRELGLDPARPCIGLLTNVFWDAQLHYRGLAFPDMRSWLLATIDYFSRRPEMQLIIRVHPGEIRGALPSRQPAVDEIRRAFPHPPPNLFVIPPESPLSTYAAMSLCDSAIIYGTKTGVELTAAGTPVIVAGEAWIRGKGITLDASDAADYFELLDRLPSGKPLDEAQTQRARRYAHHFFFRRMIPVGVVQPRRGDWPPYRVSIEALQELGPGGDPGVDLICDGILSGREFVVDPPR